MYSLHIDRSTCIYTLSKKFLDVSKNSQFTRKFYIREIKMHQKKQTHICSILIPNL